MAALEEEGLDDNTIVVFTSDNGGAGYVGLADVKPRIGAGRSPILKAVFVRRCFRNGPIELLPGRPSTRPLRTLMSCRRSWPQPSNCSHKIVRSTVKTYCH